MMVLSEMSMLVEKPSTGNVNDAVVDKEHYYDIMLVCNTRGKGSTLIMDILSVHVHAHNSKGRLMAACSETPYALLCGQDASRCTARL